VIVTDPSFTSAPEPPIVALVPFCSIAVEFSVLQSVPESSSSNVTRSDRLMLASCSPAAVLLCTLVVIVAVSSTADGIEDVALQADSTVANMNIIHNLLPIINFFIVYLPFVF